MAPVGGRLASIEALAGWCADNGAHVFHETTARGLIQDDAGAVVGIRCTGPGHASLNLRAASVVLACGGFEGNPEMLTHYLGPRARYMRPVVLVFNYGILVNKQGQRFVDEAPATVDATYEAITRVILDEPEGIAYCILDSKLDDVPNWQRSVRSDQPPVEAGSLPELAGKLGLDAQALSETVAAYNVVLP
ncbi:MAG: hypothetical protein P8Z80_09515 [Pseudolabrys sp.]